MTKRVIVRTPLQRIVGFEVAEELYDQLELLEQIILDLKIEGWVETDIAQALNISQPWVNILMHRARFKLADSKLREILELRAHYKETHYSVLEPSLEGEEDGDY